MKTFSLSELLSQSFNDFKKYWGLLLGSFAVVLGINFVASFAGGYLSDQGYGFFSIILSIVLYIVQIALSVGLIKIALAVVDGKQIKMELLWEALSTPKLLVFYFIASILVTLAVGFGLVLLVVPGIFLAVKMQFAMYYIVDKLQGPVESIGSSWKGTNGLFWKIFVFDIVVALMNIGAAMLFLLPLLITVPVTMVAMAHLYRKITS